MNKKRIFGTVHNFVEPGSVFGRVVANEGFFQTLLNLDPFDEYRFYLHSPKPLQEALSKSTLKAVSRKAVQVLPKQKLVDDIRHTDFYCFHLADPLADQTELAFLRNHFSPNIFPITSVPHSLSYSNFASEFLYEIWPGVSPRDVICATSKAAIKVLEEYYRQLRAHYHLPATWGQPALRLLPLGVDTAHFVPPTAEERATARSKFALAFDEVVCLAHGRITVDDKMDLMPLIYALHRVLQEENPPALSLFIQAKGARTTIIPRCWPRRPKHWGCP